MSTGRLALCDPVFEYRPWTIRLLTAVLEGTDGLHFVHGALVRRASLTSEAATRDGPPTLASYPCPTLDI